MLMLMLTPIAARGALFAAALCAASAKAETQLWGQMALEDLRAAHRLLADNHPGAVPARRDPAFLTRLADFSRFEALAQRVQTFGGYRALLDRFAASFADRHIARYPVLEGPVRWPGFLVIRNGSYWIVRSEVGRLPTGSRLEQCDGRSADDLAETNLAPYTPDWSLRAQRYRSSAMLFVDQSDPFITRPARCRFSRPDGTTVEQALDWRRIGREQLERALVAARQGTAIGNSLAPFRRGWWLRLGTFQDEVRQTVQALISERDRVSGTPFLVVDVRGNTGGSASYGAMIAAALYGSEAVAAATRRISPGNEDSPVWRASPGNLALIDQMVTRFTQQLGASSQPARYFREEGDAMRAALARGEAFSQSTPSESEAAPAEERLPPLRNRPRIFLLTDFACFSACLETVQLFRELGAIQIGEDTDGGLNYFEVRAAPLPSGNALFSTMQSYSRSRPLRLGPFIPTVRYEQDLSDDARVADWVASVVGTANR
jgi:hypothetical protein